MKDMRIYLKWITCIFEFPCEQRNYSCLYHWTFHNFSFGSLFPSPPHIKVPK